MALGRASGTTVAAPLANSQYLRTRRTLLDRWRSSQRPARGSSASFHDAFGLDVPLRMGRKLQVDHATSASPLFFSQATTNLGRHHRRSSPASPSLLDHRRNPREEVPHARSNSVTGVVHSASIGASTTINAGGLAADPNPAMPSMAQRQQDGAGAGTDCSGGPYRQTVGNRTIVGIAQQTEAKGPAQIPPKPKPKPRLPWSQCASAGNR